MRIPDRKRIARILALAEQPASVLTPAAAYNVVAPLLLGWEEEHLVVVALNRRRAVIAADTLTVGSDAFTIVDPRQIFRWALTRSAAAHAIILAHNHPSGDPTPSEQDCDVTRRVAAAGRVLGLLLVDHIVVGSVDRYTSFADRGDL